MVSYLSFSLRCYSSSVESGFSRFSNWASTWLAPVRPAYGASYRLMMSSRGDGFAGEILFFDFLLDFLSTGTGSGAGVAETFKKSRSNKSFDTDGSSATFYSSGGAFSGVSPMSRIDISRFGFSSCGLSGKVFGFSSSFGMVISTDGLCLNLPLSNSGCF